LLTGCPGEFNPSANETGSTSADGSETTADGGSSDAGDGDTGVGDGDGSPGDGDTGDGDGEGDGAACDVVLQNCATPSEMCVIDLPGDSTICVPQGSGSPGQPCTELSDCLEGEQCLFFTPNDGVCRRLCNSVTDCPMAPPETCLDPGSVGAGLCVPNCNPLGIACLGGDVCAPAIWGPRP
jgi:hypothetical protein